MKPQAIQWDRSRREHMCQVCNRSTEGCDRVRLRENGQFVASVHAECAVGLPWTADVVAEGVRVVDAQPEETAAKPASGWAIKRFLLALALTKREREVLANGLFCRTGSLINQAAMLANRDLKKELEADMVYTSNLRDELFGKDSG